MREIYRCPDGREVLLNFREITLMAVACTRENQTIGSYQFALVGADGEIIELMDDPGEPASIKLVDSYLADAWRHQGITERIMSMVADETLMSQLVDVPKG